MKKVLILLIVFLSMNLVNAQFIKEKAINAQIGIGMIAPYRSVSQVVGRGFFAQGELVLKAASWVEFRPYLGVVFASSDGKDINNNPTFENVASNAVLVGGKTRLRVPIPWVAPYVEIGIGASIGNFRTLTLVDNYDKSGIVAHIPFALGLELGRDNSVDLGFLYYFQPSVQQFTGAFALGITIPLKNKNDLPQN